MTDPITYRLTLAFDGYGTEEVLVTAFDVADHLEDADHAAVHVLRGDIWQDVSADVLGPIAETLRDASDDADTLPGWALGILGVTRDGLAEVYADARREAAFERADQRLTYQRAVGGGW